MNRAFAQSPGHLFVELLRREDGAGAAAAECEAGANEDGKVPNHGFKNLARLFERMGDTAARRLQTSFRHRPLEQVAVLGHLHCAQIGADQLDAIPLENALFGQRDREVEAGLPTDGGQQRVGALLDDDLLQ